MLKNMTGIAVVRSVVQRLLELALASSVGGLILDQLARTGLEVDSAWIVNTLSIFLFGVIVAAVNKWGARFAWINYFISLGQSRTGPGYVTNDADAVVIAANAGSVDTVTTIDVPPPGPNKFDEGFNPGDPGYDKWKAGQ